MKLTKKLEAEILKVYHTYWDAYLKGDMKTFASVLDDNITIFGTAVSEVFNNKKETVRFYKATAEQMTGKAQFQNRHICLQSVDNTVVIHEQNDLYVLIEKEWVFYGHARITAIFQQKKAGWKLVHQHASFPDIRTEEGEQISANKVKEENLQLREAVKRRTVELEYKNRELEIEASLERVRAVAMGMKEPADMLKICKTISQQLAKLGVTEIRNVQTAIIYESKGTYMNYEFYAKYDKLLTTEVSYINHPMSKAFVKKMLSGPNEFFKRSLKGKKVQDWYAFQKKTNQFADKYLAKASSLNYYWYSLGPVSLGISTYEPLTKEYSELFLRFLKVFELAYRRYLDIEKAHAQAREAQIEASLEKVRAVAMGMHKPDDLMKISKAVYSELQGLGFSELRNTLIDTFVDDEKYFIDYDYSEFTGGTSSKIPYSGSPIVEKYIKDIRKSGKTISEITVKGRQLEKWKKFRRDNGEIEDLRLNNLKALYYYKYSIGPGGIGISTYSRISKEKLDILHRFRDVFHLAYQRYVDIAKAEAQAREARVEAALERVRSAAMAMRSSSEIGNLIYHLYGELTKLDARLDRCFIMIVNHENKGITWWMAGQEGLLAENSFFVPMNQHASHLMYLDYCKQRKKKWTYLFQCKEKRDWDRFGFSKTELARLPEPVKAFMAAQKKVYLSGSSDKFGSLVTGSFEPLPEEQQDIISRFAVVFNQTYTRFLDLQKAEAQAREAQIEAALERVRSRSLAMHKSEELKEVIRMVLEQFIHLNIKAEHAGFYIDYKAHDDMHIWLADPNLEPFYAVIPYFDTPTWNSFLEAKTKGITLHTDLLDFKTKNKFYRSLFKLFAIPEEAKEFYLQCKGLAVSTVLLDSVGLYIENFDGTPYTDEENSILIRFGKAFQQAYTRFLDLQKVERQAREAQIEAALERVRSRTMAMRHSNELADAAQLLYQQFHSLKISTFTCGYMFINEEKNTQGGWTVLPDGTLLQDFTDFPLTGDPVLNERYKQWKNKKALHSVVVEGKVNKEHHRFLKSKVPEKFSNDILRHIPERMIFNSANFSNGYLFIISFEPFTPEEEQVVVRFAKVFEQTYTRFLDLQKAEAQAKEAQIEAALERVRARAMAMHSSNELNEVVHELRKQMGLLGQKGLETCVIHLHDESPDFIHSWAAIKPPETESEILESRINVPKKGLLIIEEAMEAYDSSRQDYIIINEGKKRKQWFSFLEKESPGSYNTLMESAKGNIENLRAFWSFADFPGGSLLMVTMKDPDDLTRNLLRRFANVFGLAYRRFADLKKAEAQARESQIQLALERVRARTMAMQNSNELLEAGEILCNEMNRLGISSLTSGYVLIEEHENIGWNYTPNPGTGKIMPQAVGISHTETAEMRKVLECWKAGEPFSIIEMDEEETIRHQTYIAERSINFPISASELLAISPPRVVLHNFYFKEGYILIVGGEKLTMEQQEIMIRFTNVFQQTYTRFLDLQKVEAQAREAQIEAALERIRSKSLAMHHSSELSTVVDTLLQEFTKLEFSLTFCIINLINGDDLSNTVWAANPETGKEAESYYMKFEDYDFHRAMWNAWKTQDKRFVYTLEGEEKRIYDEYLYSKTEFRRFPKHVQEANKALERYVAGFTFFKYSGLQTVSVNEITEAELEILERFGRVFEQAYTRFLDLQKAEVQAREAQIEAALEKVRSRTMAMHRSEELLEVINVVSDQLQQLDIRFGFVCFGITHPQGNLDFWMAAPGFGQPEKIHMPFINNPITNTLLEAHQKSTRFLTNIFSKDEMIEWSNVFFANNPDSQIMGQSKKYIQESPGLVRTTVVLKEIDVFAGKFATKPFTDEQNEIIVRFATVFEQSYTRFLDLQKAEAQAREAQIEAALERVRSRTLAMQKSDELAETAAVLFQQLIVLGIAPNRLFIIIMKEDTPDMEAWVTDEDGSKVSMGFTGNYLKNASLRKMYEGWQQQKKSLIIDMQGKELQQYFHYLHEELRVPFKGGLGQKRRIQHLAYFSHGLIGMASPDEQPAETMQLMERFAAVFNLTFTRFNDLKIAEAHAMQAEQDLIAITEAKQKAEAALTELRATQKQLVQSEKMASLGELTAGIAHEIQNPLNFVNNFSEVSTELIKEMVDEVEKGNVEEVKAIVSDLIGNLEKINHHGKRADGIVKGMLQHSRSSTGQKEPTDINALCDEYLRLAFHGLRAKDKSFNAKFETHFDETVGKLNVIPQDIGRVVLNLINNAFYTVSERKKLNQPGYEPTVSVSTNKTGNAVVIGVRDNGTGIPQKVLDKIFQPFFTTKPTGQGTGLGLSLSYDIITKGHGGELKVETKEGEGTTFLIQIPAN